MCAVAWSAKKSETYAITFDPVPATKTKKTVENPMKGLRARLSEAGIKRKYLNETVLPSWWDESLALTPGGFREVTAYISAHIGYSLKSLLDPTSELAFSQAGNVKYKKAKGKTEDDVCLSTQIALALARAVARAFSDNPSFEALPPPTEWREKLLARSDRDWVCLRHILRYSWEAGIPVVFLKNLPTAAKKPDALTTMVGDRPVIVILNGRKSPSWIAFIVAHELGHIHHGHLKPGQTLVDEKIDSNSAEQEEIDANAYAALLLTGHSNLGLHSVSRMNTKQLASQAKEFGKNYRVAPGVAALNYGFNTREWALSNGALSVLEKEDDAGLDLAGATRENLDAAEVSEEAWEFISRTTGLGA